MTSRDTAQNRTTHARTPPSDVYDTNHDVRRQYDLRINRRATQHLRTDTDNS